MSNEKTQQLPPEMVEKYIHILESTPRNGNWTHNKAEHCAQIAVEYSDELVKSKDHELSVERYKTSVMNEAYEKAKQQRDELLEALRESKMEIIKLKDHYHDVGHGLKHLMKIDELINKIDGK